jgi:hypothetical protein
LYSCWWAAGARQSKKARLTRITRIKKRITRKGSYGASRKITVYPRAKRHNFLSVYSVA